MYSKKRKIFIMMSYASHQNCTFSTANKLKRNYFEVYYCGPNIGVEGDNLEMNASNQNFKYIILDPCSSYYYSPNLIDKNTVKMKRDLFKCFLFNLEDGRLYQYFVENHKPDLILLDVHYMSLVMPFSFYGVPILLASSKIGLDKKSGLPPVNSSLVPDKGSMNWEEIEGAWKKVLNQKKRYENYFYLLEDIANNYEFDFARYFYREKAIVPFGFRFTELIFWDLEFDFPMAKEGIRDKYYLGNQVEINKKEHKVPIDEQCIIYVSLGSRLNNLTEIKLTLLREIIKAAGRLTDYQFYIATSAFQNQLQDHVTTSNITLLEFAPQLTLLSRSLLMITHGGGNSVKECIRMGVPMLCYPFEHDQFGNAARVVYHKVGLKGDSTKDKAETIQNKIITILHSLEFKERVEIFKERSIAAEESNYDVEVIKRFLKPH